MPHGPFDKRIYLFKLTSFHTNIFNHNGSLKKKNQILRIKSVFETLTQLCLKLSESQIKRAFIRAYIGLLKYYYSLLQTFQSINTEECPVVLRNSFSDYYKTKLLPRR